MTWSSLTHSWFSALSVGLCRFKHFLQFATEHRDLERLVIGPGRASKWMSWSQVSKCEQPLNEYAVKILSSVKMSWCIFPIWWGTTDKYSDVASLPCTDIHWQFHIDRSLHEYAMWSSIGNSIKMEIYLICFLLTCKVSHCTIEQKLALFDSNLHCFSQRHVLANSLCSWALFPVNLGQTERSVGPLWNLLLAHKDEHLLAFFLSSATTLTICIVVPASILLASPDLGARKILVPVAEAARGQRWCGAGRLRGAALQGAGEPAGTQTAPVPNLGVDKARFLSPFHAQEVSAVTTSSHFLSPMYQRHA